MSPLRMPKSDAWPRVRGGPHAVCLVLAAVSMAVDLGRSPACGQTLQLPEFGVAIDADGVVARQAVEPPGGPLQAARAAAARGGLPADVARGSKLRKVSLVGLDAALRRRAGKGDRPDAVERHLAGLTEIRYAFVYPDRRDIVLAGAAGAWGEDALGRAVSLETGRPVIRLEDLCVALRAFRPGAASPASVGCSIDPARASLERLRNFQRTVPTTVAESERSAVAVGMQEGLQTALGDAEIRVFGVPAATHFARVLVEADYRMKLIAIGLEPPPVPMRTYLGSLQSAGRNALQRWWFRPDYDCLRTTPDRRSCELLGRRVLLSTEDLAIAADGRLVDRGGQASGPAATFALAFTQKYPQIADRSPVFAQLRNQIDLLVVAAFMGREEWQATVDWDAAGLLDERIVATETLPPPRRVPCAVNVVWKGNVLLAPAGGITIDAREAFASGRIRPDEAGAVAKAREASVPPADAGWWWD